MASFPNAVKTFTTKQDGSGNVIFASHINDLQDEVNAIEDGLRNGTAPLNSSNSTFTHLSAGASTFASLNIISPPPSIRVTNSVTTNVPDGTAVAIPFDTERWATIAGLHSTGVNPSRLTATSSGLWSICGHVSWRGGSTGAGVCAVAIRVDGSSQIAISEDKDPGTLIQSVATQYYVRTSGQYLELVVNQNSGSTKSIESGNDFSPEFMMTRIY